MKISSSNYHINIVKIMHNSHGVCLGCCDETSGGCSPNSPGVPFPGVHITAVRVSHGVRQTQCFFQCGKTVQCFPLTSLLITCLTRLFTWIHEYCVTSKTEKELCTSRSIATENNLFVTKYYLFSKEGYLYISWKLVWRFSREIECRVSYLFSWIGIIRDWSAFDKSFCLLSSGIWLFESIYGI